MSIKDNIQVIILILSIIPHFVYLLGVLMLATAFGSERRIAAANIAQIAGLTLYVPLAGTSILVFFLVPPLNTLSIATTASLISTTVGIMLTLTRPLILLTGAPLWFVLESASTRSRLARKKANNEFDLFLCYNEEDKTNVIQLANQLQREGVLLWPDPREVQSGYLQQMALTDENIKTKAAAVCVGKEGTGPWQKQEVNAFLREFVAEGLPVIPILLPNALQKPVLPLFLRGVIWIDLRQITRWKDFRAETANSMRLLLDEIERKGIHKPQPPTFSEPEQAVREIRLALYNSDYSKYERLSLAIISLIQATERTYIESSDSWSGPAWEITLPACGFPPQKALFFLRTEKLSNSQRELLIKEKDARETNFILIVDLLKNLESPRFPGLRFIWLKPEDLLEVISTPDVVSWLGRLIASEDEYFASLIPYSCEGVANLFYGRAYELEQLAGNTVNGGIIIGTHQSGKTSLLYKLSERLKTQEGYIVIGPHTYHSTHFLPFFEQTLESLDLTIPDELTIETWASTLRSYRTRGKCPILLLDEVDLLLEQDKAIGFPLGREMRALQYDGYCKFYLAGSKRLYEAVRLEGNPFRNFARQVILKGLERPAVLRLIQEPMHDIGFTISDKQAEWIYRGTAGVPVLIQEFCRSLLIHLHQDKNRNPIIADTTIEKVEQNSAYLNFVFHYYDFPETGKTMPVMLIVAQLGQAGRPDILQAFAKYGVRLNWNQVDQYLEFLTQFDVLNEFEPGRYRISSIYQHKAIESRIYNSDAILISQLERSEKG